MVLGHVNDSCSKCHGAVPMDTKVASMAVAPSVMDFMLKPRRIWPARSEVRHADEGHSGFLVYNFISHSNFFAILL